MPKTPTEQEAYALLDEIEAEELAEEAASGGAEDAE
jgi:hypothetical protein